MAVRKVEWIQCVDEAVLLLLLDEDNAYLDDRR
jgi:hypothetical protein